MNVLTRALLVGFGVGAVSILALRGLVSGLAGALIAALVAVAIIIGVGFYYHQHVSATERQAAGDNLYYLGLLFTLLTLMLALFQLFVLDAGGTVDERAYELIGNFSVALVSTVAGILARILLHSGLTELGPASRTGEDDFAMGSDITGPGMRDETAALRSDLARLRSALREATDAFSHFNRVTAIQSEEVIAHTGGVMRKFNEGIVSAVSAQLDQATATLQGATETLRSQSDALTHHFVSVIADFNSNLTTIAKQGMEETGVVWRTAAYEMRADGQKQIERVCEDINKLVSGTEGAWNEMQVLSGRVVSAGDDMNAHATEMRKMAQDSADARRGITQFIEQIEDSHRRLQATADAADNAARSAASSAGAIARIESSLESDLKRVGEAALHGYQAAATELTNNAREQLETDRIEWLKNANGANAELDRHREASADSLKQAQRLSQEMSEEAKQWGKLAEHTRRALVDVIDRLAERVTKG